MDAFVQLSHSQYRTLHICIIVFHSQQCKANIPHLETPHDVTFYNKHRKSGAALIWYFTLHCLTNSVVKVKPVPLRHKVMCWSGGRTPHILSFGARQRWVVINTPDHLTPENVRMDVPQLVWTFRKLAESVSAAVNPLASSRGLFHCLSHCAYSHCREKLYLHASIRLRDAHRATTLCVHTCDKRAEPHDRQSAALCGGRLHAVSNCQ